MPVNKTKQGIIILIVPGIRQMAGVQHRTSHSLLLALRDGDGDAQRINFLIVRSAHLAWIDALNESSFEEWYLYPVFLLLTVFLLRKKKMAEITANLCSCSKEDESSKSYIDKVHIS